MSDFISSLTGGNKDRVEMKSVDLQGEPFKTFKFKTESVQPQHQATIIYQKNIGGDVGIYGNEVFGIYGVAKYGTTASQSFVLGQGRLGLNALGDKSSEYEIVRIVPPQDDFREHFLSTVFIETSETTAVMGDYVWT
jgi:hypothetical protein